MGAEQLKFRRNIAIVSRETILPQATNEGRSCIGSSNRGGTIQADPLFSAQPIGRTAILLCSAQIQRKWAPKNRPTRLKFGAHFRCLPEWALPEYALFFLPVSAGKIAPFFVLHGLNMYFALY